MPLITCQNVSLAYENKTVVENLSFEVNPGDYLCIIGENGSGKSTLIKGLLGLKHPVKGSIILGNELSHTGIGYLPQQTVVQKDFPASVFEVVLSGTLNRRGMRPFYSDSDKKRALLSMEKLDILPLKKICYRELSGGQQQRVLLARALCATGKLLLLDEPVSGLDPVATASLYRIIEELNRKDGITIIMVSHDIDSALSSSTHILHMKNTSLFFGTTQEYISSEIGKRWLGGETDA